MKNITHKFLKRVVTLCLIMLCIITIGVLALSWHSGEQLSSSTVASLVGAWCGELLMSLLKRNKDTEVDKEKENFSLEEDYEENNNSSEDEI